jgi:hypothetical protein
MYNVIDYSTDDCTHFLHIQRIIATYLPSWCLAELLSIKYLKYTCRLTNLTIANCILRDLYQDRHLICLNLVIFYVRAYARAHVYMCVRARVCVVIDLTFDYYPYVTTRLQSRITSLVIRLMWYV